MRHRAVRRQTATVGRQAIGDAGPDRAVPSRDVPLRLAIGLIAPRLQPSQQPAQAFALSRLQLVGLRTQPDDLDFGIAADVGRRGDVADPPPRLLRRAAFQVGLVGANRASEAAQRNAEIVQCFLILGVAEALECGVGFGEPGQRQLARRLLGRALELFARECGHASLPTPSAVAA